MDEIKMSDDLKNVSITEELAKKIKYLVKKDIISRYYYDKINTSMSYRIFDEVITNLTNRCNFQLGITKNMDAGKDIVEQYRESLPKKSITEEYQHMLAYYFKNDKMPLLVETVNNIYQINKKIDEYNLTIDLINAKKDAIINMKYFMDEEEIVSFNRAYTDAQKKEDIDTMQRLLGEVQEKILMEWTDYFGDLDAMTDDNFCFLGHSSKTAEYSGNFKTRYVSCSLFNQDINDAFNNDFGFIMKPINIVGACSNDMYIDNDAIDEEELVEYSSIKQINHPQRLIDECMDYNQRNKVSSSYSEVVLDGFYPEAIFALPMVLKVLIIIIQVLINYKRAFQI